MLRPLGDRVLISLAPPAERSAGGIYIPTTAQEKNAEGTIVAVGPGRVTAEGRLVEPRVKKGDRVMYSKYSGTELKVEGILHVIVSEEEIIGVLDESTST